MREAKWDKGATAIFLRGLNHIELRFDSATLGDKMSLRKATEADKQAFREASDTGPFALTLGGAPEVGSAFGELETSPADFKEAKETADEALRRLMLALRVLKEGGISMNDQLVTQPTGYRKVDWLLPSLGGDWGFLGPTYLLYEGELGTLAGLYKGLNAVASNVAPAVHRFDLGCRRPDRNDRFIDWWVALESLFGDRRGELAYKLSLRISYVVDERDGRPSLARQLRRAYDARSSVVHGQQPKDIKIHEHVTGSALRSALRKLILAGRNVDLEKLDDFIAAGGEYVSGGNDARSS